MNPTGGAVEAAVDVAEDAGCQAGAGAASCFRAGAAGAGCAVAGGPSVCDAGAAEFTAG